MSDPRLLFTVVFLLVLGERILELAISVRNQRRALAQGGVLVREDPYAWIVGVHSLFMISAPLEVWLLDPIRVPGLAGTMLVVMVASMTLRYWAIFSLGERWNTRVICVPGLAAVHSGPYRWIRHPNYVAVGLEVFALPLMGGAWRTAILFGIANLLVLRWRIRVEEEALSRYADWERIFAGQSRFVPGVQSSERP